MQDPDCNNVEVGGEPCSSRLQCQGTLGFRRGNWKSLSATEYYCLGHYTEDAGKDIVAFELLTLNNGHRWAIQHKASMFRSNLEAGLHPNGSSAGLF